MGRKLDRAGDLLWISAQREPEVQPDRMGDDLWWEAMALVADRLAHVSQSTRLAVMPELT